MTEEDVLRAAERLPGAREVGAARFAPITASPLLIARVRGPGGSGGRRVHAGVVLQPPAFAVLVEGSGRDPSASAYGSAAACAHAFNAELVRATRDGLAADPEPQEITPGQLLRLAAGLLG